MSKQSIWNRLVNLGFNDFAAAGIMANIEAESAYLSNNAQDGFGWEDTAYTNGVDTGTISRDQFAKDSIGYGLCQWTYYTRKYGLYDLAKKRGVSISDEDMQLDYLYVELTTQYTDCYKDLLNATDAYSAAYSFCTKFEAPANAQAQGQYRGNKATSIYNEFAGSATVTEQEPKQEVVSISGGEEDVLHVVKSGDKTWYGNALQSLLKAHGYDISVDKDVRSKTMNAFQDFASGYGLDVEEDFGQLVYLLFSE